MTISAGKDHVIDNQVCSCAQGFAGGNQALCRPNGCMHNGKQYPVGAFKPSACEHCQCDHTGRVNCAIQDCFYSPCVDAVHKPDVCCPVCPNGNNCYVGKKIIPAGKDYNDGHQICRCQEGIHFGHGGQQAICRVTLITTATAVLP
ncbi:von Willebrand factor C domain-containing protein 2-like [Argopecten irradians]|uniref:von Willebrand factor C domain-containing protein 2-like n=1 Tax=Argopecten irradians TaxID=31199 RepID=UPI003723020F